MEILDNVIIVRNYSDPQNMYGAWNRAKALVDTVQFTEELKAIYNGRHNADLTEDDALNNWLIVMQSSQRMWKEDCEDLNLDNLTHWLIYESKDEAELSFRLNKIKGLLCGYMWNKTEFSSLHSSVLHIIPRLTEIMLNREDNAFMCMYDLEAFEKDCHHWSWSVVQYICKWLEDVSSLQERIQSIIADAESILNPQPTPTETEPRDPIFDNWDIFEDVWVVSTFQALIKDKILSIDKGYFRWHWDRSLLLWFCKQMSEYCGHTKERNGKQQISWITFNDMFVCQVWGKWQVQSNKDLRSAWQDWMKAPQSDDNGNPIPPKGWNVIEGIICKNYKQ